MPAAGPAGEPATVGARLFGPIEVAAGGRRLGPRDLGGVDWVTQVRSDQIGWSGLFNRRATTTVLLVNRGIPEADRESHREGWDASFDNLDEVLTGTTGRREAR